MLFTPIGTNQADHTRIRKLFSHAFSDSALLEQEPLLTIYFKLLVLKLKEKIDGPAQGRVDMMAFYNFTTFDIIGYFLLPFLSNSGTLFDVCIVTLSSASPSELSRVASIIRG